MIYERPIVEVMCSAQAFWNQRIAQQFDEPTEMDWRARKIKEFIDNQRGNADWDLDAVCKELALPMSGRQARRLFRGCLGIAIKKYIQKIRMTAAEALLRTTDTPVKSIALQLGYRHTSHFARSFKSIFLLTPMEFRMFWRKATVGRERLDSHEELVLSSG